MTSKEVNKNLPVRRLRRFFSLEPIQGVGALHYLSSEETWHLKKILRLKPGDLCLITDSGGSEAEALIESFEGERTRVSIQKVTQSNMDLGERNDGPKIYLYIAMPQRAKMNDLVEKAQELGVDRLIPLETDHSAFKIPSVRQEAVLERWKKISQEAAKQSGASRLLEISSIQKWSEAWSLISPGEPALLCHPESVLSLAQWSTDQLRTKDALLSALKIHLWIGPEGGFSPREVKEASARGIVQVHLGTKILKVDTAMIVAVGFLKLCLEQNPKG